MAKIGLSRPRDHGAFVLGCRGERAASGSLEFVMGHFRFGGVFYGVVDLAETEDVLVRAEKLALALLSGGASAVQVRMKRGSTRAMVEVARIVRRLAREAGVPLIVNDRLDVALAARADGVHLGQDDLPLAEARQVIAASGRSLVVGVSTHNLEQAVAAARAGADYLGFGPVFPTSTKENPDPVQGLDALAQVTRAVAPVPVVAIGGVTPARTRSILDAGAACACALSAVNSAPDVIAAARLISGEWAPSG
ncbi:MAG: thiamine phosphate synthase [Deltaproteobacteria bacterium]|nr:thiamine phosphate synthase [Deltaproteobacteria bacterium]